MIEITLKDDSKLSFDKPEISGEEIAKEISEGLYKNAIAVRVNDTLKDLNYEITTNAKISIITNKDKEGLEILRHTASHIMAQAVEELFKNVQVTIGPVIDDGFYYDFSKKEPFSVEDFEKIEKRMHEIVEKNLPIVREEWKRNDAIDFFSKRGENYKVEIIKDLPEDVVISVYKQGDYVDLCRGPHLVSTGKLGKAFKLMKIAGAYWRGNSNNEMLQRIYATAFFTEKDLKSYLTLLEEAEKRDHRKLGKTLELWHFDETASGCPYLLPKGLIIFNELVSFWRKEHKKRGYQEFAGPLLNSSKLWKTSGHWEHYKEDMYIINQGEESIEDANVFALKPMSCPATMILFNLKTRSYQDLPIRFSDVDCIHRNEATGALNGLFRARQFHQDDAHIFVTEDQIEAEYQRIFEIADYFYKIFNLKYSMKLSTRPDDFIGEIETWNHAENVLRKVLDDHLGKSNYEIKEKDGAFYGPKVDIQMKDALGREWQMGTIQLDFQLAGRFGCKYTDTNGEQKTPIVIHRVIYGSLERFMGLITEHFAGAFPVWICPVQVRVLPVSDKHREKGKEIVDKLLSLGVRAEIEKHSNTISYQIREAHNEKIPYSIILGDKEVESDAISVRRRDNKQENNIKLDDFINHIMNIIEMKSLEL